MEFNYKKLFKGVPKNYYLSKEDRQELLDAIEGAQETFGRQHGDFILADGKFTPHKALEFCNVRCTDTIEEAICNYVLAALNPKYSEYEQFVQYTVDELKKYENGYRNKK